MPSTKVPAASDLSGPSLAQAGQTVLVYSSMVYGLGLRPAMPKSRPETSRSDEQLFEQIDVGPDLIETPFPETLAANASIPNPAASVAASAQPVDPSSSSYLAINASPSL